MSIDPKRRRTRDVRRTFREKTDDLPHFVLESDFENSICLVDDEGSEVVEHESFRVLQEGAIPIIRE